MIIDSSEDSCIYIPSMRMTRFSLNRKDDIKEIIVEVIRFYSSMIPSLIVLTLESSFVTNFVMSLIF